MLHFFFDFRIFLKKFFKKILLDLQKLQKKKKHHLFTYFGEPLLYQKIPECLEVNTFGYSYDALYKVTSRQSTTTNGTTTITFFVKAQSDAHILMANSAKAVEEIGKPCKFIKIPKQKKAPKKPFPQ